MRWIGILFLGAAIATSPLRGQDLSATLTLDQAIRLALQHNRNLKVVSFERGISRANLLVARGQFDPSIVGSRSASDSPVDTSIGELQLDNIRTDSYSVGVQGLSPIGTLYSLSGGTLNQRDMYSGYRNNYLTSGGFSITQPLLKGFGFDANLAAIRIAKANRSISDLDYRQSAIDTVTDVVVAYSNLQLAHDSLDVARRTRELAASLLADNEKEFRIGFISQSEVIAAKSQVATLEEPILIADRAVRDSENQLRNLIGEDAFFEEKPLFTLVHMEVFQVDIQPRADLQQALNSRPDYQTARLAIVKYRASEAAAVNGLLPQVNFVGGYGYNGLAYTFAGSREMVQERQNPSYQAGLAITIPLSFAVGRGTLRAARLQRRQSEASLEQLEANIALSVATAAGQIETARKRVKADRAAYALAQEALDAEEKKKRAGATTTLAVVQEQQALAFVENNVSAALAAERQAVAIYDHELGRSLERYSIKLEAP